MNVLYLTNEYPPYTYGGAGVHIEYLSREMARHAQVEVRTFHEQSEDLESGALKVRGTKLEPDFLDGCPPEFRSPLKALTTCLAFNGQGIQADVVHCHTWYTHFAGILAQKLYGVPFVLTVHSLEPLRPWKREQLGRGYDLSSWVEHTAITQADAVIAVSEGTKADILRFFPEVDASRVPVIHNGIDIDEYRPVEDLPLLRSNEIDPEKPYVLFVGRMTRQKGLYYLLKAAHALDPGIQLVLCAGGADTPQMQAELEGMVQELQEEREGVVWIPEMVPRPTAIALFSQATVFCCPSIYEPFGIINLEAMACGTAVVASGVGGIPEVVQEGETGLLVDAELSDEAPYDPTNAERFAERLAEAINTVAGDPELARRMGEAGRARVEECFSWSRIAEQTFELYGSLTAEK